MSKGKLTTKQFRRRHRVADRKEIMAKASNKSFIRPEGFEVIENEEVKEQEEDDNVAVAELSEDSDAAQETEIKEEDSEENAEAEKKENKKKTEEEE